MASDKLIGTLERRFYTGKPREDPTSANDRPPELDHSSSANGRAGPMTDTARPFAELDQPSSANGRAGSTGTRLRLVLVTPLPRLL
ncbi:hypothetical protein DY000_02034213 [Brassica cretica]|uniref:Uncharacterized protein n=1 Tax=Brassica cretica TaxID=69181 RepID=A0ABQ7DXB5_BRACR|nr:hypothetical protein DY000_02034213 [Brassica cretica]